MMDLSDVRPGDPAHAAATELVELLGEACADFLRTWHDCDEARGIVASAAMLFAGTQMGLLFATGELAESQRRVVVASAARNFLAGMVAGEDRGGKETLQ